MIYNNKSAGPSMLEFKGKISFSVFIKQKIYISLEKKVYK